jgi:hypothetical protein
VKVMATVQEAPAARVAVPESAQLLVLEKAKSVGLVPVTVTLVRVSGAVPVLDSVTLCAEEVWPGATLKVIEVAESDAVAVPEEPEPAPVLDPLPQPVKTNARAKKAATEEQNLTGISNPGKKRMEKQ